MATIEEKVQDNTDKKRVRQIEKEISQPESGKSRLTYLVIDGTITKEDYDPETFLPSQKRLGMPHWRAE